MNKNDFILKYDRKIWEEIIAEPVNTLQLFVTNRCNLRCRGCFYKHKLGEEEMSLSDCRNYIKNYSAQIKKVILLGGEPTLHKDLKSIIAYIRDLGLRTTVYSNGVNLKPIENTDLSNTQIRVGVYGSYSSEKPLSRVPKTKLPLTIVYMLRRDNIKELMETALMSEEFNCRKFFISSIRDIATTQDYWKDTEETITPMDYADIIQNFIDNYKGNLKEIHISNRGIMRTEKQDFDEIRCCRFGNIFPDREKIICPFDIAKKITTSELIFGKRICTKHHHCILQKIVLKRI